MYWKIGLGTKDVGLRIVPRPQDRHRLALHAVPIPQHKRIREGDRSAVYRDGIEVDIDADIRSIKKRIDFGGMGVVAPDVDGVAARTYR